MNSLNENIHPASIVELDKKTRIRILAEVSVQVLSCILPHKLTVTGNPSMHSLRFWRGKWGSAQCLYASWSQASGSLHEQLECHFTQ